MSSIVYVLSNEAMPGLLKIGKTTDMPRRMGKLYSTGVPLPFDCEFAVAVPDDQATKIETALHLAFEPHRVNPRREFFRMRLEQAEALLKAWPGAEDVTDSARRVLERDVSQGERDAVKRERRRRPNLDLEALGVMAGDTLESTGGGDAATVKVVDASHQTVHHNGETMHLRDATYRVTGKEQGTTIRQAAHWKFKGRVLVDLYDELHSEAETEELRRRG